MFDKIYVSHKNRNNRYGSDHGTIYFLIGGSCSLMVMLSRLMLGLS